MFEITPHILVEKDPQGNPTLYICVKEHTYCVDGLTGNLFWKSSTQLPFEQCLHKGIFYSSVGSKDDALFKE